MNNPQIILADEPAGALDSIIGIEIMAIFQRLNHDAGISIILVTHDADIASYANRNLLFKDGRLHGDERIEQPQDAQTDLEALPAEETKAGASS